MDPSSPTIDPKKTCPYCPKVRDNLSDKSWKQHITNHIDPDKECTFCDISVRRSGWARHCKSSSHKEKERLYNAKTTGTPKEKDDERISKSLNDFLSISEGALCHLASAFREAIKKYGGGELNGFPLTTGTDIWKNLGIIPPEVFSSAGIWNAKPSSENFLNDLVSFFNKDTTNIYIRGQPHEPCPDAPIMTVLNQLQNPMAEATYYATNIRCDVAKMRLPERFSVGEPVYEKDNIVTTTNITPKYTFVDMHIDHGKSVITTLHGGCVKLWALYPPTKLNLDLFQGVYESDNIFINIWHKLEGGLFTITSARESDDYPDTIFMPPGCLHATYTLEGGLTPGIEFTTAGCLDIAAAVWDINSSSTREIGKDDSRPFLEAVIMALDSEEPRKQERAVELFCINQKKFIKSKASFMNMVRRKQGTRCKHCNKSWKSH